MLAEMFGLVYFYEVFTQLFYACFFVCVSLNTDEFDFRVIVKDKIIFILNNLLIILN